MNSGDNGGGSSSSGDDCGGSGNVSVKCGRKKGVKERKEGTTRKGDRVGEGAEDSRIFPHTVLTVFLPSRVSVFCLVAPRTHLKG